ncbi:hypothetical protein SDC9_199277 [bioreactor metagenome]|uniref:Uncharacterized protein n=1 Tax=bioreactor metagenome TaxID=1076179 RepID=A0A645IK06_9ZZZZ
MSISLTGHSQIHAYLGALASKIGPQTFQNLNRNIFDNANSVLIGPGQLTGHFLKFVFTGFTDRTLIRSFGPFMDITTHGTNKFLHLGSS